MKKKSPKSKIKESRVRRTKQMKRRHHGRGWMLNKGNRSPLNTNQFIIDRYEFDDNSVDENLNYGSISDELSIERIEEELLFLSKKKPRSSKGDLKSVDRMLIDDFFFNKFSSRKPRKNDSVETFSMFSGGSEANNENVCIQKMMDKMSKQEKEIMELKERVKLLEQRN